MSARRLPVGSRLALGYAAMILVSGALLLGGAYVIVARASARYDDAVATHVQQRLAERRARLLPERLGAPPGLPLPGDERAERRATVAAQHAALPAYRREIALRFLGLLAAVTIVSLGVGRVLAARALRPVRDITRAAMGIGEDDVDVRLGADGPDDELTELARTLDGMLERIQAAVQAQGAFAAHASHELRTPLSVIRAEIDACLDREDTSPEQWRRSAEAVRRNARRSEHLVQQLLLLARGRTRPVVRHRVDLAETAQALLDELPAHCAVRSRLAEAPTEGDPALLEAAVANLLDNAVRYNLATGAIELISWTERGQACLTVGNDGPPIEAGDVERLFEPFFRSRQDGNQYATGLGLAIVHGIVHAHGGTVDATTRTRGGLDVTIRLPSRAPPREPEPIDGDRRTRGDGSFTSGCGDLPGGCGGCGGSAAHREPTLAGPAEQRRAHGRDRRM
jgi:signal transduction histidine kinase